MWFTMATIMNLVLLVMSIIYRTLWKEAGRRWNKETKQLQAENMELKQEGDMMWDGLNGQVAELQAELDKKITALENIVKASDRLEETLAYMEMTKIAEQALENKFYCKTCKGIGTIRCDICCGEGELSAGAHTNECFDCDGLGKIPCPDCNTQALNGQKGGK